jgi:hypothetical protein
MSMTVSELSSLLVQHREKPFRLLLPRGSAVPVSFHITEVGHVVKKFLDCGGRVHRQEACLLQAWVGEDGDHRLAAGKLLGIIGKARFSVLPANADALPVEIEYEDGMLSQYGLTDSSVEDGAVVLHLAEKHTDCLAKDVCLAPAPGAAACCGGGKC